MSSKKRFRDRTIFRADHLSYESDFHSSLGLCLKYSLSSVLEPDPDFFVGAGASEKTPSPGYCCGT